MLDKILFYEHPVNDIIPFQCELPEEYDFHRYWDWIQAQLVPLIRRVVSEHKKNPINIIYIANNENGPFILHQRLNQYFRSSDFDLSNTPNEIYDR